jgi:hypothetical protein
MMRPLCMILGVWLRCMPPPRIVLEKVLRPPMVVGGGLEEDVCEMKERPGLRPGNPQPARTS